MKTVGFVVHPARPVALDVASALSRWLDEQGVRARRLPDDSLAPS